MRSRPSANWRADSTRPSWPRTDSSRRSTRRRAARRFPSKSPAGRSPAIRRKPRRASISASSRRYKTSPSMPMRRRQLSASSRSLAGWCFRSAITAAAWIRPEYAPARACRTCATEWRCSVGSSRSRVRRTPAPGWSARSLSFRFPPPCGEG